jgi:citrate lyase subunit beta / citryl-CoA lyase
MPQPEKRPRAGPVPVVVAQADRRGAAPPAGQRRSSVTRAMPDAVFPARRSCLAVPGSSAGMLDKALALAADEIVVDLEDAVAAPAKAEARAAVAARLADPAWRRRTVSVRVNGPGTAWCQDDVIALAHRTTALVVPKVEGAGDLAFVDRLLDGAGAEHVRLQALVETAAGLAKAGEIARSSARLDALILGYADLATSLGRSRHVPLDLWAPAQHDVLLAARAHGLQAIDGPHLGTAADGAFRAAARRARDLGFDGKWAIHPSQVEPLNAIFAPSDDELAQARAVLDTLERAEREAGAGTAALDGQMIDNAMRVAALRTLARAAGPT